MSTILKTAERTTLVPRSKVRRVVAEVYADRNGFDSNQRNGLLVRVTKKKSIKLPKDKK